MEYNLMQGGCVVHVVWLVACSPDCVIHVAGFVLCDLCCGMCCERVLNVF